MRKSSAPSTIAEPEITPGDTAIPRRVNMIEFD
jgi:hypothetical protein